MAAAGNDLIVDEVLLGDEKAEYRQLLAPFDGALGRRFGAARGAGERERSRGDRLIGLSRWQYDKVHRDRTYDLEIDTSDATPLECAELIKQQFESLGRERRRFHERHTGRLHFRDCGLQRTAEVDGAAGIHDHAGLEAEAPCIKGGIGDTEIGGEAHQGQCV